MIRNLIEDAEDIETLWNTFDILDYMDDRWVQVSFQYNPKKDDKILSIKPDESRMLPNEVYFNIEISQREDRAFYIYFSKNGYNNFSAKLSYRTINKLFSYLEDKYEKPISELSYGLFDYALPYDTIGNIGNTISCFRYDEKSQYYPDPTLEFCIKYKYVKFTSSINGNAKFLRFDHSDAFLKISPDVSRFANGEITKWYQPHEVELFFTMLEDQYGDSIENISKGLVTYDCLKPNPTSSWLSNYQQLKKAALNYAFPVIKPPEILKFYDPVLSSNITNDGRRILNKYYANKKYGPLVIDYTDSILPK